MGPLIRKNFGFIDKYIGDAIMGLFENADDALQSAIDMLAHLPKYDGLVKSRNYQNSYS